MPYKDKNKQREANRLAMQKSRQGITADVKPRPDVIPERPPEVIDGKYNKEYLPGGLYYVGVCEQGGDGKWRVKSNPARPSKPN